MMFYYAQYDTTTYEVGNVTTSESEIISTGFAQITEEQYISGDLVGKYYNPFTGNFDVQREWVCDTTYVQYKTTNAMLEEKLDAMDGAIEGKADTDHTHNEYAAIDHNHDTVYSAAGHTHTNLVTTETYTEGMSGKADTSHTHDEYATTAAMNTALGGKSNASHTHDVATESTNGLMGYADKEKLNGIEAGANNYTHPESHSAEMITGLSEVATSGSYNDLSDKPTIPTTLPANGGNADTVDGKNAADFATADHNHDSDYADIAHTHAQSDITGLEAALSGKADATHSHSNYVTDEDFSELETTVSDKASASHTHTQYSETTHTHTLDVISDTSGYVKMTAAERTKLSGIASGANKITVDSSLSGTSTNPVQNNVINTALAGKANSSHTHSQSDISGLATALSGKANTSHTHAQSEVTGLSTALNGKVDKVDGKALSTNDYTTAEKNKLAGIAAGANAYTHPTYTAKTSGLYKVTVDSTGHVSGATAVTKADITALGIPAQDTNTTYGNATTSAAGLMSTADKTKLDGIATGANKYTHPAYTAKSSGLYKVTVDSTGHVSATTAVAKSDITALGIPSTNTTYSNATTSAAGLMSASDKSKLDGIATGANKTTVDSALSSTSTNPVQNKVINSALAGKAASSHTHALTAVTGLMNLLLTDENGKQKTTITGNVLTTIANLSAGVHTAYSGGGSNATATNAPNTIESWRYLIHKNLAAYGWVLAFGSEGSLFINYLDNGTWRGWKPIWDNNPAPLWSGAVFMNANQTVTPTKKLSECKNGWVLLWSDYDTANGGATNGDVFASYIPKRCYNGGNWGGHSWLVDIPAEATASAETRCIKKVYVWNDRIQGNSINEQNSRNDVVLRAIYEF